jgi:hypothetical protein
MHWLGVGGVTRHTESGRGHRCWNSILEHRYVVVVSDNWCVVGVVRVVACHLLLSLRQVTSCDSEFETNSEFQNFNFFSSTATTRPTLTSLTTHVTDAISRTTTTFHDAGLETHIGYVFFFISFALLTPQHSQFSNSPYLPESPSSSQQLSPTSHSITPSFTTPSAPKKKHVCRTNGRRSRRVVPHVSFSFFWLH